MIASLIVSIILAAPSSEATSSSSRSLIIYKRRIGLRLPNILHLKNSFAPSVDGTGSGYDKRRIGMRVPNIIYVRNDESDDMGKRIQMMNGDVCCDD